MDTWKIEKKNISNKLMLKKILDSILLILETVSVISIAYSIQNLVNAFIYNEDGLLYLILTIVLLVVQCLLGFFANRLFNDLGTRAREYVRGFAFKRTLYNDSLLNKYQTGDLLSRIFDDAGDVGERLGQRSVLFSAGFIQTIILLVMLFLVDWGVGLCIVLIYPIYFLLMGLVNKRIKTALFQVRDNQAKAEHVLLKGLDAFLVLTVLNKQDYYAKIYAGKLSDTSKRFFSYNRYGAIGLTLTNVICTSLPVIAVIICTYFVMGNTPATLLIYILAGYLVQPLTSLSNLFQYMSEDKALEQRFSEIIGKDNKSDNDFVKIDDIKDVDINLTSATIGEKKIVYDSDIHLNKGDFLLIKGESGRGKSTLLKLLIDQAPGCVAEGEILVDGLNVKMLDKTTLYNYVSYVNQTNFIFEGTLLENICMGDKYSDTLVQEVIKIACLDELVEQKGLDYYILENGSNLSIGQIQRICIARALIRAPKLLLLDEPTSALDEQNSVSLMNNLLEYVKKNNIMAICVTHRNTSIEDSCKIVDL